MALISVSSQHGAAIQCLTPLDRTAADLRHVTIAKGTEVAASVFEVNPSTFKTTLPSKPPIFVKTPPAGYKGRGH